MLFRCNKTSEAGPEIVPGIFRVESAERGIGSRFAGGLIGLILFAEVLWIVHLHYLVSAGGVKLAKDEIASMRYVLFGTLWTGGAALALVAVWASEGARERAKLLLRELRRQRELGSRTSVPMLGGFLFLLVPKRSREHVVGDLQEEYQTDIFPVTCWFFAWCWWWRQVLGIVGPYLLKRAKRVLGLEIVRGWRRR